MKKKPGKEGLLLQPVNRLFRISKGWDKDKIYASFIRDSATAILPTHESLRHQKMNYCVLLQKMENIQSN